MHVRVYNIVLARVGTSTPCLVLCFVDPRDCRRVIAIVKKSRQADENLSHLDGIVSAALAAGAVGYSPPAEADDDSDEEGAMGGAGGGSSFNLTPYARPSQVRAWRRGGRIAAFVGLCVVGCRQAESFMSRKKEPLFSFFPLLFGACPASMPG